MQYINRYRGSTTRILPSLNGKWHSEAVTEGLKFIKHRKFIAIGGMKSYRPTQCLAGNDIKPQNFTSSVTS